MLNSKGDTYKSMNRCVHKPSFLMPGHILHMYVFMYGTAQYKVDTLM